MKKSYCLLIGLAATVGAAAQTIDVEQQMEQMIKLYNEYEGSQQQSFEAYRSRLNAEFAEYMRQVWPEYEAKPAVPVPELPEPPAPVIKDPDTEPTNDPLPFDNVTPAPVPVKPPQPIVPLPEPKPIAPKPMPEPKPIPEPRPVEPQRPTEPQFTFSFYGTPCAVSLTEAHRFRLSGVDENSVADAWLLLSADRYSPVIAECLQWRDRLHLPDWGYVRFVEKMTEQFLTPNLRNEARLMQMYILTQSGYKVRIARAGNSLVLLLPSKDGIYKYSYLTINNSRYYIVDKETRHTSFCVFDREFPKEQYFSLQMQEQPRLAVKNAAQRRLTSNRYSSASASVATNRNLVDFYNDYPQTDAWAVYIKSSLSKDVKEQLYPALQKSIAGKSKAEAANILLNFVQTAFAYKTDEAQFGYERPLFGDETLYYPYCDCEDRAILYSILVRELLGLDTVLLYYPNHLATAVCFNTEVSGDYMEIDGKRYIVCDPTYINAEVGQAMPQFKQTKARIIKTPPVR